MIGHTLKKVSQTSFSPKSFNNKYGVPLSLLNLKQNDHFGILEVGMDKKGEIDKLTKMDLMDKVVMGGPDETRYSRGHTPTKDPSERWQHFFPSTARDLERWWAAYIV